MSEVTPRRPCGFFNPARHPGRALRQQAGYPEPEPACLEGSLRTCVRRDRRQVQTGLASAVAETDGRYRPPSHRDALVRPALFSAPFLAPLSSATAPVRPWPRPRSVRGYDHWKRAGLRDVRFWPWLPLSLRWGARPLLVEPCKLGFGLTLAHYVRPGTLSGSASSSPSGSRAVSANSRSQALELSSDNLPESVSIKSSTSAFKSPGSTTFSPACWKMTSFRALRSPPNASFTSWRFRMGKPDDRSPAAPVGTPEPSR